MLAFIDSIPTWIQALTTLISGATAVTMLTPTKVDNQFIAVILRLLNVLSGNVLANKNADDVDGG